jgi:hypothetical protein
MRLEGTLDAFSLPDIFQLLSFTKKSGALHLRRPLGEGSGHLHGVVHLRGGKVTGARSDASRQELSRRLVGTGLVDDESLAQAAEELADDPGAGLARLLAEKADLEAAPAAKVAGEQITDAVFDLLRWPEGEFAFVVDESSVDDLGAELSVEELVAEGQRRLESWAAVVEQVPAAHSVLRLAPSAPGELSVSAEEWSLLALVDGRRTVADLVGLSGQGEYAVVKALAALVGRGLLVPGDGDDRLLRRHQLLSALEGVAVEVPVPPALAQPEPGPRPLLLPPSPPGAACRRRARPRGARAAGLRPGAGPQAPSPRADAPVIPERPEPFTPVRRPSTPSTCPATVRAQLGGGSVTPINGHGSVHGATAMQPEAVPSGLVERDPNVNKSLLLRLIAGVRGL